MPDDDKLQMHSLRMLAYLYKTGAVDHRSAVRFTDLSEFLQVDDADAHELIENARSDGLLRVSGAVKRRSGTSYSDAKLWSTRRGADEGERWWRAWFAEPEDEVLDPREIEEVAAQVDEAYAFWVREFWPHMGDWYPDPRN